MADRIERETAKIYQFPAGGRASRATSRKRTEDQVTVPRHAHVDFGSGWYHDAAIETERSSKH